MVTCFYFNLLVVREVLKIEEKGEWRRLLLFIRLLHHLRHQREGGEETQSIKSLVKALMVVLASRDQLIIISFSIKKERLVITKQGGQSVKCIP